MSKAFIAGNISGVTKTTAYARFDKAREYMENRGFEVVNPLELHHENDIKVNFGPYMRVDIEAMMSCTTIVFLPDWNQSPEGRMLFELANTLSFYTFFIDQINIS